MSLAGCQINPIDVNFHSADKVWSKNDRGWKVPCLMPIRVKVWAWFIFDLGSRPNLFIFFFETRKIRIFIVINDYWQFKTLIFLGMAWKRNLILSSFFAPLSPLLFFSAQVLDFLLIATARSIKRHFYFPD